MKPSGVAPKTFLKRLGQDTRGNALAIMAIATIPVTALAGSAIDTSRMYFVKVRLQQACDSGALAGRKFMVDTTYSADANQKAEMFFDNNFKVGVFGTKSRTRIFSKTSDNQVRGTASAVVPMTLTKMIGAGDATINVTCQAKLDIPNLDVMFVLDTTGSMGLTNPSDSVSRISALRSSVVSFYDALEGSKTNSSQIRYGFVPYSSTVNVGMLLKRDWMVDSWTYQSRAPADITEKTNTSTQGEWNASTYSGWTTLSGSTETFVTYGLPENCFAPPNTQKTASSSTSWTTNPNGSQGRTTTETITGSSFSANLSNGVCKITETRYNNLKRSRVETRTKNPNWGSTSSSTAKTYWWNYQPVTFDVSGLKGNGGSGLMAGGTFQAMINGGNGSQWSNRAITWNSSSACIEERATVRQSDYPSIPTDAYDLDVDMVPSASDPATQWRPWLPQLVYARRYTSYSNPTTSTANWPASTTAPVRHNGDYINLSGYPNDYAACPSAARKLAAINKGTLTSYLNGLKVAGRTYHDIGFLWGLRLLSPDGIFASENTTAPNGSAIARHVIFMTDGKTETNFGDYDAYGLAGIDRRRTDASRLPYGDAEQNTLVEKRLTALCQVAKNKNMTVWVIAFGTSLTPLLSDCASSESNSFEAKNAAELNSAFANIASNIAKLRVSE